MKRNIHFWSYLAHISHYFSEQEMFQTMRCRDNQNIHFVFSNIFFPPQNCAVYEAMWKNVVERGRPRMTVWRMGTACWIPKAINTHIQVV